MIKQTRAIAVPHQLSSCVQQDRPRISRILYQHLQCIAGGFNGYVANTLTAAIGLCLSTQGASSPPGRVPACRPSKALRVSKGSIEVFITHKGEPNPKLNTKSNSPAVRGETEF